MMLYHRTWLLLLLIRDVAGQTYYVSDVKSGLADVNDVCTLASPRLHDDGDTIKLSIKDIDHTKCPIVDGTKLWIGYVETLTEFSYVGCSSNLPQDKEQKQLTNKDVGRCYSVCDTDLVGLSERNCYCLNTLPTKAPDENCDGNCNRPLGALCGNSAQQSPPTMSIYKKDEFKRVAKFTDFTYGACLTAQLPGPSYGWHTCQSNLLFICQSGTYNVTKPNFTYGSSIRRAWDNGMQFCIQQNLYPALYNGIESFNNFDSGQYWIGGLRSFIVTKKQLTTNISINNIRRGFIEYKNNLFYLHFEELTAVNKELNSLCKTEMTSTSTEEIKGAETTQTTDKITISIVIPSIIGLLILLGIGVWVFHKRKRSNAEKNERRRVSYLAVAKMANESTDNHNIQETASGNAVTKDSKTIIYDTTTHSYDKSGYIYETSEDADAAYSQTNTLGTREPTRNELYHHIDLMNKPENEGDTYCHTNTLGIKEPSRNELYHHMELVDKHGNEGDTYCHANTLGIAEPSRNELYHHMELVNKQGNEGDTYCHANTLGIEETSRNELYHHADLVCTPGNVDETYSHVVCK